MRRVLVDVCVFKEAVDREIEIKEAVAARESASAAVVQILHGVVCDRIFCCIVKY